MEEPPQKEEFFDSYLSATPWSVVRSDTELYVGSEVPPDLQELRRLYRYVLHIRFPSALKNKNIFSRNSEAGFLKK